MVIVNHHKNECFMIKEGQIINIPDYDKALYYTLWGQWDELLLLMVRTQDDLLSKKIHLFLNDYHYSTDKLKVIESHDNLLYYVEHAMKNTPTIMMKV